MARTYRETITTPAAARGARAPARPFISVLSDFGSRDPSAGIMRAVMAGICRDAVIVDLAHEIDRFAIRDGALVLWSAAPYLPIGTHLAVVDPGVGTDRLAIAIETARGDHLVGPDNGLLLPAAARLGGILRVHALEDPRFRLSPVSSSFQGRDIFAPAAAHLAARLPLEELGPQLDPSSLSVLDWPEPEVRPGFLRSQVIYIDGFGNVKLSAMAGDLMTAFMGPRLGERFVVRVSDPEGQRELLADWLETFGHAPVGATILFPDSYSRLALAVNQGSAAATHGIRRDTELMITRMAPPATPYPGWAYQAAPRPNPPAAPYPPPPGAAIGPPGGAIGPSGRPGQPSRPGQLGPIGPAQVRRRRG